MAAAKRNKITARDITGLKYFDRLAPLLERLHDVGYERDRAGIVNCTSTGIACWACSICSIRS